MSSEDSSRSFYPWLLLLSAGAIFIFLQYYTRRDLQFERLRQQHLEQEQGAEPEPARATPVMNDSAAPTPAAAATRRAPRRRNAATQTP